MIVIDGKNSILGRLSSFVAKEALKGNEVSVINCGDIIITGNKKNVEDKFQKRRGRVGSGQKGPKHHRNSEKIVKRSIRGMLPNYKLGRGAIAFKKIKCYKGIPKELESIKPIKVFAEKKKKNLKIKELERK